MQYNILRDSNITKIYLVYVENGSKKRYQVSLRFMDQKECYFAAQIPVGFSKPKRKTPVSIKVYTQDGVYDTDVVILDSQTTLRELMFEVSIPKNWKFTQLRQSSRKLTELAMTIKFNDGYIIEAKTHDLSLGGVSYLSEKQIPSIYKKLSGIITIEFPKENIINFPDDKLITETKYCREVIDTEQFEEKTLFAFKFMSLSQEDSEILKHYLLHLN